MPSGRRRRRARSPRGTSGLTADLGGGMHTLGRVGVVEVVIARATVEHAGELLTVQRAAYLSEAQRYSDPFLPPLTQPLAEIVEDVRSGRRLVALQGLRVVGSVRVEERAGVVHVGRLAVAPDQQGPRDRQATAARCRGNSRAAHSDLRAVHRNRQWRQPPTVRRARLPAGPARETCKGTRPVVSAEAPRPETLSGRESVTPHRWKWTDRGPWSCRSQDNRGAG